MVCESQFAPPLRFGNGVGVTLTVLQIYAKGLVNLMEKLQELETEAAIWAREGATPERFQSVSAIISKAEDGCELLDLPSARKQIARMRALSSEGSEGMTYEQFRTFVTELRVRLKEDLDDKVFLCVNDRSTVDRFFIVTNEDEYIPPTPMGVLVPRAAHQLFHKSITERMEETSDDIVEACRCFVADRFTACVFHLMKIVEYGLLEVARLVGITDPKPSWGSILQRLDRLCNHTRFDELPDTVKPHLAMIRELLPRMHAIQHAWRNKVLHVDNHLIVTGGINEEIAKDIMNAVEIFMKTLVAQLPPRTT